MTRLLVVLLIVAAFLLGWTARALASSALGPAPVIPAAIVFGADEPDQGRTGAPHTPHSPDVPRSGEPASHAPSGDPLAPRTSITGIASWGRGWTGVVTRLPRGTRIRVCGPLGCWSGRSTGYGPARWTHRIADLSPAVFLELCGPLSAGLCRVTVSW